MSGCSKSEQMKLKFAKDDMRMILFALDFYSRIWMGQYDHILWELRWSRECNDLDKYDKELRRRFLDIRNILLPGIAGYDLNGSYGIFSHERDFRAGVAYNMQQVFRYSLAWYKHPQGGMTVDFEKPLPCGDDPYPFPEAICFGEGGNTIIEIKIVPSQLDIIRDALYVTKAALDTDMRRLFHYYTGDENVLSMCDEISGILGQINETYSTGREAIIEVIKKVEGLYQNKG